MYLRLVLDRHVCPVTGVSLPLLMRVLQSHGHVLFCSRDRDLKLLKVSMDLYVSLAAAKAQEALWSPLFGWVTLLWERPRNGEPFLRLVSLVMPACLTAASGVCAGLLSLQNRHQVGYRLFFR